MNHTLLRYHGGKFRLADWILSHFPKHDVYVEPFGGGASVLLAKQKSRLEIYNDLDGDIVNLFEVLRDPVLSERLATVIELTPYSRDEFVAAKANVIDPIERARRLVVRAQMGFGSAGATKLNTGFRIDTLRGGSDIVTIWRRQPEVVRQAADRLRNVLVENRDAMQLIQDHDADDTLFFLDPPYVKDTRSIGSDVYRYEMTNKQHQDLIDLIMAVKGKVILCGYQHKIYDKLPWKQFSKSVAGCGQSGSVNRQEILWVNPQAENQHDLFRGVV